MVSWRWAGLFLVVLQVSLVKKKVNRRSLENPIPEPSDKSREDWLRCTPEVLRLACNAMNLASTGSRPVMADRLWSFYHPPQEAVTDNINEDEGALDAVQFELPTSASATITSTDMNSIIAQQVRLEIQRFFTQNSTLTLPGIPQRTNPLPQPPTSLASQAMAAAASPPPLASLQQLMSWPQSSSAPDIAPTTQAPTPGTPSFQSMPALPKAVIDKIRAGEFVNFDNLLPNHSPVSNEEFAFKVVGGSSPSVSLVPKHQTKPKISNFNSWMVAWTNFVRAYTIFWPHRIQEMILYQATIADYANQFSFHAWSGYDRMFRYRMAHDATLSWSRHDENIYNRYLRGAPLQNLCFTCRNFGHYANACPLRAGGQASADSSPPFRAPQRTVSAAEALPPFHGPPRPGGTGANGQRNRYTCNYFNNNGQCSSESCRFAHKCRVCFGPHAASECPKRSAR